MTTRRVDLDKLRVALRRMSRGNLLMIAERAIEIVPKAKLQALVGDMVRLDDLAEGTEAFIAEFDRLLTKCIRAAMKRPQGPVREAFELLFALIRQIDEDPDGVVFFADEAGSWQFGVEWREALPAYFQCLAATAPGEEFAREVDRTITDFADYERPKHLAAARRIANAEQKAALRRLPAEERRPWETLEMWSSSCGGRE